MINQTRCSVETCRRDDETDREREREKVGQRALHPFFPWRVYFCANTCNTVPCIFVPRVQTEHLPIQQFVSNKHGESDLYNCNAALYVWMIRLHVLAVNATLKTSLCLTIRYSILQPFFKVWALSDKHGNFLSGLKLYVFIFRCPRAEHKFFLKLAFAASNAYC